jgi:hypothetical protein
MAEVVDPNVYTSILKEHYTDQYVENMVYKNNPFHALLPKDEKFGGKYHPVPIQFGDNQSRSHDFNVAQNKSKTQYAKYDSFFIDSVENYQIARIPTKSILQSQGDVAAFLPIATKEIDSAINNLTRDLAIGEYRTGYGERGRIATAMTVAGATVVTLENPNDITNFEVGMELDCSISIGSNILKARGTNGNGLIITKISRRVGSESMTFGFAIDDAADGIPLIAAGDYLFQSGDRESTIPTKRTKLCGVLGWIPEVAPSAGENFWGVDRSVDSRLYGNFVDCSGLPIEEAVEELDAIVTREGGNLDYTFMNSMDFKAFKKAVGSRVVLVNVKANATIGFTGIEISSQKGTIKVLPDQNCPYGYIVGVQLDTWKLYSMGKAVRCIDLDGLNMLRVGTADAVEIRYGSYSQVACKAPAWNGIAKLR